MSETTSQVIQQAMSTLILNGKFNLLPVGTIADAMFASFGMADFEFRSVNTDLNNKPESDLIMQIFNNHVETFRVVQQNMEGFVNHTASDTYFTRFFSANILPEEVAI